MRIGLISDTHIPEHAKELPDQLKEVFRGVDLILHAGDVYNVSVLDELEGIAPVLAAEGDDDYYEVINNKRVKKKHVLDIDGVTIWLSHTMPYAWDEGEKRPDVIVFGHTHEAAMEEKGDVLLINPGSATFPGYQHKLGTVALLTISSGKVKANIVQLQ